MVITAMINGGSRAPASAGASAAATGDDLTWSVTINRWQWALTFAFPGASTRRDADLHVVGGWLGRALPTAWALTIVIAGAIGFAIGYLMPGTGWDDEDDDESRHLVGSAAPPA